MNNRMNDDYAIDLAQYYGVSFSGSDNASSSTNYHPNLPSLEQIASYNLQNARAEAARQNAMNSQTHQGMSNSNMSGSSMGSLGTSSQMLTAPGTGTSSYPTNDNSMNMGTTSDSGTMTQTSLSRPILEYNQPYPITAESIQYLNGFIRSQIGRNVSIEFLVGTNQLVTKDGFLLAVGANFILLNPKGTDDILACDFYNIKFITFYY